MILTGDYHTHTVYSHGKGNIEENIKEAVKKGLKTIAITDHGYAHRSFGVNDRKIAKMRKEIIEVQKNYDIEILLGVEANLTGLDGTVDLRKEKFKDLDIFLMGAHKFIAYHKVSDWYYLLICNFFANRVKRYSKKLTARNTKAYIEAIKKYPIDAVTHLDFDTHVDAVEIAKAAADYGTYIEINSKREHLSPEILKEIENAGANFLVCSDAHKAERIGDVNLAFEIIKKAGLNLERIHNIDGRKPNFRFKEFKDRNL